MLATMRQAEQHTRPLDLSQTLVRLPWGHLALMTLLFLASAEGRIGNADCGVMLAQARSILEGKMSIAFEGHSAVGLGGLRYSQYGILTSVLWIPFVLAGRMLNLIGVGLGKEACEEFAVSFCAPLVMSAVFVGLADVWRRLGADRVAVIRGLWIMGLGTMLWTYAKLPSSDALMALGIVMALREWLVARQSGSELIAGVWLGVALLARKQAVLIVPLFLILWVVWRAWGTPGHLVRTALRSVSGFAVSFMPTLIVLLWYNWARFGSPFVENYPNSQIDPITFQSWSNAFLGLCVDDASGIVWYAFPAVVGMALGARSLYARSPFLLMTAVVLIGSQMAFLACLPYWRGGVASGPRLMLFGVVLLALPFGVLPSRLPPRSAILLWLALGVGVAITVPCVLTDPLPVESRALLEPASGSRFVHRNRELLVTLGLANRPEQHRQVSELMHPPFQTPNLWWAQILRELRSRYTSRKAVREAGRFNSGLG